MNILTVLDKEQALELADFLDDLSVNGSESNRGICAKVSDLSRSNRERRETRLWLRRSFALWPKCSGDLSHPIRSGIGAGKAYYTLKKWSKCTQYGRDRRELCTFLANLIRSQCNEKI